MGGQVGARLTSCALKGCRAMWGGVGVEPKWRSEWAEMEEWGGGEPETQSLRLLLLLRARPRPRRGMPGDATGLEAQALHWMVQQALPWTGLDIFGV